MSTKVIAQVTHDGQQFEDVGCVTEFDSSRKKIKFKEPLRQIALLKGALGARYKIIDSNEEVDYTKIIHPMDIKH